MTVQKDILIDEEQKIGNTKKHFNTLVPEIYFKVLKASNLSII